MEENNKKKVKFILPISEDRAKEMYQKMLESSELLERHDVDKEGLYRLNSDTMTTYKKDQPVGLDVIMMVTPTTEDDENAITGEEILSLMDMTVANNIEDIVIWRYRDVVNSDNNYSVSINIPTIIFNELSPDQRPNPFTEISFDEIEDIIENQPSIQPNHLKDDDIYYISEMPYDRYEEDLSTHETLKRIDIVMFVYRLTPEEVETSRDTIVNHFGMKDNGKTRFIFKGNELKKYMTSKKPGLFEKIHWRVGI